MRVASPTAIAIAILAWDTAGTERSKKVSLEARDIATMSIRAGGARRP